MKVSGEKCDTLSGIPRAKITTQAEETCTGTPLMSRILTQFICLINIFQALFFVQCWRFNDE
jgi:hypothetical protein